MNKRTVIIFIVFMLIGFTIGFLIGETTIKDSNTNEAKEPTAYELLERLNGE